MNHGVFEVLAADADQERAVNTRAVIAAQSRAKESFGAYVEMAGTQAERDARIGVIAYDLDTMMARVAEEYGGDIDMLRNAATVALGGGHPSGCTCGFCKNKGNLPGAKKDDDSDDDDDGDADDKDDKDDKEESKKPWESSTKTACSCPAHDGGKCTCSAECKDDCPTCKKASVKQAVQIRQTVASAAPYDWERVAAVHEADGFSFCKCNCAGCDEGNHCESENCIETKHSGNPGNPDAAGSSEKTSAEVETGDTYAAETVDLPSSKDSFGDVGSPKIDKSNSGDNLGWSTPKIEVPSQRNPEERQQIHQTPEYKADLPGVSETGKEIDPDSSLQPEHHVAPNTETWTGTEGQADPVTSAVLAKWQVLT